MKLTHEQILLDVLKDGDWHDHHMLYGLGIMLHSRVASLTAKGYRIEREQRGRTHFYRLKSRPLNEGAAPLNRQTPSLSSREPWAHSDPRPAPPDVGSSSERPAAQQLSLDLRQEAA